MKISINVQNYTLDCICVLYDTIKERHANYVTELGTRQFDAAVLNLLDKLIISFKTKLLNKQHKKDFTISLEYYQAFFLAQFLFEYRTEFKGLAEKTLLNLVATKIAQEL